MIPPGEKVYLGDSVYAVCDKHGELLLTTENGGWPSNSIILEPEVLRNLLDYVKAVMPHIE